MCIHTCTPMNTHTCTCSLTQLLRALGHLTAHPTPRPHSHRSTWPAGLTYQMHTCHAAHPRAPQRHTRAPSRDKPTFATRTSNHWGLKPLSGHWAVTPGPAWSLGKGRVPWPDKGRRQIRFGSSARPRSLRAHEFVRGSHSVDGSHWGSWRPCSKPPASPVKGGSACPGWLQALAPALHAPLWPLRPPSNPGPEALGPHSRAHCPG